jgi:hypothetical protein
MSPEQQRICIAEACGWHRGTNYSKQEEFGDGTVWRKGDNGTRSVALNPAGLPDYLNDLNAMHDAEKVMNDAAYGNFENFLNDAICAADKMQCVKTITGSVVVMPSNIFIRWCSPTAAQRAEAFLRAMGKWVD